MLYLLVGDRLGVDLPLLILRDRGRIILVATLMAEGERRENGGKKGSPPGRIRWKQFHFGWDRVAHEPVKVYNLCPFLEVANVSDKGLK